MYKTHRKTTSKRGVTIPAIIASATGIDTLTPIDIECDEKGRVIISKPYHQCRLCGSVNNAVRFRGMEICRNCVEELAKEVLGK